MLNECHHKWARGDRFFIFFDFVNPSRYNYFKIYFHLLVAWMELRETQVIRKVFASKNNE